MHINTKPNKRNSNELVNESIRFPEVLLIGKDGESLGIVSRNKALALAYQDDLDVFCVAPSGKPPVCKIMNYSKYRFELQKKEREARKNQKVIDTKEVQLSPQIDIHDLETKARHAHKFLSNGDKVKIALRFRGRQLAHTEVGEEVINKFLTYIEEVGVVEKKPALDGKLMICIVSSKIKK